MEQYPPFFKDEHQKTDESLNAERDKTNESLIKIKAKAEIKANQSAA